MKLFQKKTKQKLLFSCVNRLEFNLNLKKKSKMENNSFHISNPVKIKRLLTI